MPTTGKRISKPALVASILLLSLVTWLLLYPKSTTNPKGKTESTSVTDQSPKAKALKERIREKAALPPGQRPGAIPMASGISSAQKSFEAREFIELTDDSRETLKQLILQFQSAEWERRVELLDEIEALSYGEEIIPFIEKILTNESETEVRERALELLAGNTSAKIIPLLETALTDKEEGIRLSAIIAASDVKGPEFDRFIRTVFSHSDKNTRLAGFEILDHQSVTARVRALEEAMSSGHKELQIPAIDELQFESNHQSVEILIPYLDAADPDIRENAQFTISFLLNEDFESASEAQNWWQANKAEFDAELIQQ